IELIKEKNPEYIFYLVNFIKQDDNYKKNWIHFNEIFEILLTPQNVENFIVAIKEIPYSENYLLNLFCKFNNTNNKINYEIFEISKKYLEAKYKEIEESFAKENKKWDRTSQVYSSFKSKLQPTTDKEIFSNDLFIFYREHKEIIGKFISTEEKERLIRLLRTVLGYDFRNSTIKITSVTNGTTSYSQSMNLAVFATA